MVPCAIFRLSGVKMKKLGANGIGMKKSFFALLFILYCGAIFAQTQGFSLGRFSFSMIPKILKNGSMMDLTLGYDYTERLGGELQLRFSSEAENKKMESLAASLIANEESSLDVSLLPVKFYLLRNEDTGLELYAGPGIYYKYQAKNQEGYFNMEALEKIGKEKVNSFTNDFSLHLLGPEAELGLHVRGEWADISIRGGIVPIFFLAAAQQMDITPLMESVIYDHSRQTVGSPLVFADMSLVLFKYAQAALLYDAAWLDYEDVSFKYDTDAGKFFWTHPVLETVTQSLKLELSALIPLGSVRFQIGWGHTFDSVQSGSNSPAKRQRDYLILCVKSTK
jgi:hypothetical protein